MTKSNPKYQLKGADYWLPSQIRPKELHPDIKPDVFALSQYRRSIADFVRIICKKHVPVVFRESKDDSGTDGKRVIITSTISPFNFDAVVGTAMHEGSHIRDTDFKLWFKLPKLVTKKLDLVAKAEKLGITNVHTYTKKHQLKEEGQLTDHVRTNLNIFEDRRIDNNTYKMSPGYRVYYKAMYADAWQSETIDKLIADPTKFVKKTVDTYLFYVCNLINKNVDLDVLPGLRDIFRLADLRHIGRFTNTAGILELSYEVYNIILDNVDPAEQAEENKVFEKIRKMKNAMDKARERLKYLLGKGADDLSEEELQEIAEALKNQKEFLDGETEKIAISGELADKLNILMDSESSLIEIEPKGDYKGTECLVVKKVTDAMLDGTVFSAFEPFQSETALKCIDGGMNLGRVLGKKLKIRNETKVTEYTRKKQGVLNRRMLHEVSFGNTDIFTQTEIEFFQDALIHITWDASSSMGGTKWENSMTSIVAICKAAEMSRNIDVVVSTRGVQLVNDNVLPTVIVVYDSRRDTLHRLRLVLAHIRCNASTPEGLCFEAMIKDLFRREPARKLYLLNFSDGEPFFMNNDIHYGGESAHEHTRLMVNEIRKFGMEVLSYFLKSDTTLGGDAREAFMHMYGKDAAFIDVLNIIDVAKTINKKLLIK